MTHLSKVLILSASYGEGHQQAAKAVQEALGLMSPQTEVRIVDYMRSVHPLIDSFAKYFYVKSVQFAPALYGLFYKGTSQIAPSSLIQRQLNSLGIEELAEQLNDYHPDVILATFPTPAGVVSYLKRQSRTAIPLATIITDHAIHSQWIHANTDLYFVGSGHVKRGLMARGIQGDSIRVTGIPVRPAFLQSFDKSDLYQKFGLNPDLPVVLVMGGGYGMMGDIQPVCEELFTYPHPIQVIVVTGKNERLRAQLEAVLQYATNPSFVYGFVSEVYELMAITDLMLTKAGGLTVSEALALQVPMLLYRPIPGQEVQNARFLTTSGVAVFARNRKQVSEHLYDLLIGNPGKREMMRRKSLRVRRLHAAEEIAAGLIELASERRTRAHYFYQP